MSKAPAAQPKVVVVTDYKPTGKELAQLRLQKVVALNNSAGPPSPPIHRQQRRRHKRQQAAGQRPW